MSSTFNSPITRFSTSPFLYLLYDYSIKLFEIKLFE